MNISVIIPCYNQAQYLAEAIDSIPRRDGVEIIVVADRGDDVADVAKIADEKGVRYLVPPVNLGLAGARNYGINRAKGDWILPLDADDTLPGYAIDVYQEAIQSGKADVYYGAVKTFGDYVSVWYEPCGWGLDGLMKKNRLPYASLFKKEDWSAVGGYPVNMRLGLEDWAFWLKLAHSGRRFGQIMKVMLHYRKHGESMITRTAKRWDQAIESMMAALPWLRDMGQIERKRLALPVSFTVM